MHKNEGIGGLIWFFFQNLCAIFLKFMYYWDISAKIQNKIESKDIQRSRI